MNNKKLGNEFENELAELKSKSEVLTNEFNASKQKFTEEMQAIPELKVVAQLQGQITNLTNQKNSETTKETITLVNGKYTKTIDKTKKLWKYLSISKNLPSELIFWGEIWSAIPF